MSEAFAKPSESAKATQLRDPHLNAAIMRPNRLRELLDAGKPLPGTRVLTSWPTIIELIGHSGMFDYDEFCGEYVPYDHSTLENMGRAIELFDHLGVMIKIEQQSRAHTAVRAVKRLKTGLDETWKPDRCALENQSLNILCGFLIGSCNRVTPSEVGR